MPQMGNNGKTTSLPALLLPSSPGFIEHKVSKFDTLAGIAIKYGVEVADIKKMNGLATDLQMFARRSLQIPLPGRHPPSPCVSNDESESPRLKNACQTPTDHVLCDLFDSFQSLRLKTPPQRTSSLQGFYYGLKPVQGCEMAVNQKRGANHLENGLYLKPSPSFNLPLNHHRKSRSLVNGFLDENGDLIDNIYAGEAGEASQDRLNDKLVRRRQKSEADFTARTPETMMKEDNTRSRAFLGKGLALRSKSRTSLASDNESGGLNPSPVALGDGVLVDPISGVRKSSSTSSLQDEETSSSNSSISSLWPSSKWKPDLLALSTAAITGPIFDGLAKPISGKRNKTAVD